MEPCMVDTFLRESARRRHGTRQRAPCCGAWAADRRRRRAQVPVLAKADSMTTNELRDFRAHVRAQLEHVRALYRFYPQQLHQ